MKETEDLSEDTENVKSVQNEKEKGAGLDLTALKKAAVIESLSNGATVEAAAKGADIAVRTLYHWKAADSKFKADWIAAMESRVDAVEDSLYTKATGGHILAAIFWLCNRARDRWEHVAKIQHGGSVEQRHSLSALIAAANAGEFGALPEVQPKALVEASQSATPEAPESQPKALSEDTRTGEADDAAE